MNTHILANANIYDNVVFTQRQISTTLTEMSDLSLLRNLRKNLLGSIWMFTQNIKVPGKDQRCR